jgi:hypothetical protein
MRVGFSDSLVLVCCVFFPQVCRFWDLRTRDTKDLLCSLSFDYVLIIYIIKSVRIQFKTHHFHVMSTAVPCLDKCTTRSRNVQYFVLLPGKLP